MPASSPPTTAPPMIGPPPGRRRHFRRTREFWERLTEGLALQELWSTFKTDARTGYRLYRREVAGSLQPGRRRRWRTIKAFFWAIVMKLSPARRVLLVIALVLIMSPTVVYEGNRGTQITFGSFIGSLLLLAVLTLEVADRVTMKRDLEIAREIQSWLVPEVPPRIPGYEFAFVTRPANTVAGDYYDIFARNQNGCPDSVVLTVADVAGKGIPAALLMASFQASLRALSSTPSSLDEVIQRLNRAVCSNSQGGRRFTTAFVAELDSSTGQLTYVNAGHNPPVLCRSSGQIERLTCGGMPLGISVDAPYARGHAKVAPGDLLFVFTDGLVEAENQGAEEFGETRLLRLLGASASAAEIIHLVMGGVEAFVGSTRQHDDITCLAMLRPS